jgi:hypothetical protein
MVAMLRGRKNFWHGRRKKRYLGLSENQRSWRAPKTAPPLTARWRSTPKMGGMRVGDKAGVTKARAPSAKRGKAKAGGSSSDFEKKLNWIGEYSESPSG